MIDTRFNVQTSSNQQTVRLLIQRMIAQVPGVGELVNIRGVPYVVISRAWSIDEAVGDFGSLNAYVTVLPASK